MGATSLKYVNTYWDAKDDSRTIIIRSEVNEWLGNRMFLAETISTGRKRLISLRTLLNKYKRNG